jgi:hypothetical protein
MTEQHPITPPPELVQQWWEESNHRQYTGSEAEEYVVSMAAQWGADQELEACCEWLREELKLTVLTLDVGLRAARRPKPPSLKEQALAVLEEEPEGSKELIVFDTDQINIIRKALEQLDD